MTIQQYINNINQRYLLGNATEHTFRADLQQLIESVVPTIRATNEPKRQSCGAPDYILTKKDIPVGFIEAKDLGDKDLEGKKKAGNKEQFDRYKASLSNLIFTNYLEFYVYHNGEFITKIAIGEITDTGIVPLPQNFNAFENLLKDFCVHVSQTIKSAKKLAEMMAGKARLLSDVIEKALTSDQYNKENSTLKEQMTAFSAILIHDITPKGFADVYAQTIAYGLFAARLHDPTLESFTRQEAAELIPKSNPFLRKLFGYIAGPDIDDRIKWIVDNLSEIFLACNVDEILKNYGKATKMEDPIIHFYETFLSEYDPKLRKARGVWYTPAPVVNFIVRAVDDILKTEFNLPNGLANTSKTTIKVKTQNTDKRTTTGYKQEELEVHRVQILDPATGTGTFLAEVIKHIYKQFKGQEGIWSSYVENNLLPRLNGFELLMASYAMAHLKLDLLLTEKGFKPTFNQRFKVYLTNSLEEHHPDTGTLFANWLSAEANEANQIKRDTPVMCILGNPPYSGESANKGDWIMSLMEDYKKEPGGKEKLKERNPKMINDDYVKFLRFGQHFIEKNGSGVLAFINPHGFLDNPTFRGMRWNLLKTYDTIYTIDLHGNSRKNETGLDGSIDQNVFDIMQGVAITVFVKTGNKKTNELANVFHYDLYGKREFKYNFLSKNSIKDIPFKCLKNKKPMYYMVPKDYELKESYENGFEVFKLFNNYSSGVKTSNDKILVNFCKDDLLYNVSSQYNINVKENKIKKYSYKPFIDKFIYYDESLIGRSRSNYMSNFIDKENYTLCLMRNLVNTSNYNTVFVSKSIIDINYYGFQTYSLALYLYPETNDQQLTTNAANNQQLTTNTAKPATPERVPNLNIGIIKKIEQAFQPFIATFEFTLQSLTYNPTVENDVSEYLEGYPRQFGPLDILDYIYAVLHSPNYREKYKEFLKIDFPRVPYPKNPFNFWRLVKLGSELRKLHLLESPTVENYTTSYPKSGDNKITTKIGIKDWELFDKENALGRIWINDEQYFDNIPLVAWEFYIGGYQPAQKWLKDRQERTLNFEDILHYQKIIVALTETDRLMSAIDKITIDA